MKLGFHCVVAKKYPYLPHERDFNSKTPPLTPLEIPLHIYISLIFFRKFVPGLHFTVNSALNVLQLLVRRIWSQMSLSDGILFHPSTSPTRLHSRWSVARAFSLGKFLNLLLAHREEVYILKEARHKNILIGGNFSLSFYHCKGIFDFS